MSNRNAQKSGLVTRDSGFVRSDSVVRQSCESRVPSPESLACSSVIALIFFASLAHADALIDPTRPAFAPTKSSPSAVRSVDPVSRVTAIFQTGNRRVAVLDGAVVKVGDHIGDVVIQEILADGVRFTRGGRVELARLSKQAASVRSDVRKQSITAGE